jgi:acyl-CoA synthetase (AMP-forming)/AMP-acid ligase II
MFPIDFFWRASLRWPDRIAIDTPNGSITYNELARKVKALAGGLIALDSQLQSRVAICAGNSADHIIALLAILACGKSWVPLNPKSTRPEIRRIIDITEPSLIIYDEACADLLVDAPGLFILTGIENEQPSSKTVSGLIKLHDGAAPPSFEVSLDAIQAIKFTGGTTGAPKGVMQPYRAWMANISNQIHSWGFDENERYIVAAPITHGTSTYIVPILAQGGCHVILDGAGAEVVRTAFKERAGTACFMPPTLLYMLMALPNASRKDYPKLRRLIYGGAPIPPEKVRAVREFFGPVLCTTIDP